MNHPAATLEIARKVLATVNAGLVSGLGRPVPGQMCVEAAVCYAMDLPHSDRPTCVGAAVRAFKIRLNDARWSSNQARTDGLRKLAIAQLGSDSIDQKAFRLIVAEQTIRKIVPIALRASAKRASTANADALEAAASRCEQEGTLASARTASQVADAAYAAAVAVAVAAAAAAAAYAAVAAAAAAAAYAAAAAAYAAAAYAADADAADADAAAAAAYAAAAYAAAVAAADAVARDEVLRVSAQIGLDALIALGSPGCAFLYLVDEVVA